MLDKAVILERVITAAEDTANSMSVTVEAFDLGPVFLQVREASGATKNGTYTITVSGNTITVTGGWVAGEIATFVLGRKV